MSGSYPLGPEWNPGWVPGYVPSASEWNQAWSKKVDFDDPIMDGAPWLSLSGGEMTGPLILHAMPVDPREAATKEYVDQFTPVAGPFLSLSGGTMTGVLTLAVDPSGMMDAATKGYVDGVGSTASLALTTAQGALSRTGGTMTGPLILGGDPSNPLAAATKQYVDRFLPLVGGTLTGTLTTNQFSDIVVGRNLYSTSAFFANSYNSWEWAFSVDAATGTKYQAFRAGGWYNAWVGTTGQRIWQGPAGQLMTLDSSGTLYTRNGANIAGQGVNYPAYGAHRFAFNWDGQINAYVDGGYQGNIAFTGWVGSNYVPKVGNSTITGNLDMTGSSYAIGNFAAGGAVTAGNGILQMNSDSSGPFLQMYWNWYWKWLFAGGTMYWVHEGLGSFWVMSTDTGKYCYNNLGPVAGHGPYSDWSDIRSKIDVTPSETGLDVITRLNPIRFRRVIKTAGDPITSEREEVGFSAQDVQQVLPEAVVAIRQPEAEEGDEGELTMATTPIVAALVNAVKELSQRLAAVEARSPA